jgi:hypothetical protein
MASWKIWLGKKVYLVSKNMSHPFSGTVIDVEERPDNPIIWITINDKFGKRVTFVASEILSIKED